MNVFMNVLIIVFLLILTGINSLDDVAHIPENNGAMSSKSKGIRVIISGPTPAPTPAPPTATSVSNSNSGLSTPSSSYSADPTA